MSGLSAYEEHMLGRLREEGEALAAAFGEAAESPLSSMLDIARRARGAPKEEALRALNEMAGSHPDVATRARIAEVAREIASLPPRDPPRPPPPRDPPLRPDEFYLTRMQPGERCRVVRTFKDFDGDVVEAGTILTYQSHSYFPYDGGYTIHFAERTLRFAEIHSESAKVLENEGLQYVVRWPQDGGEPGPRDDA